MKNEKILITSALPYANGPLHFGHIAGAYLPADCYARFQRLCEKDVLYVCGSDEYGVAIILSAEMAGRTPKEQVDLFHEINKNLFKLLNFSFDNYSRTTCEGHAELAQEFFLDLLNNGYIEKRVTKQLYSKEDNRFLADRYVTGECPKCAFEEARGDECPKCGASFDAIDLKNPKSKLTKSSLVLKETTHWFLCLEKFKEKLLKWVKEKNWKPNVTKFVHNFIEDIKARPITRDLEWGVPVPLEDAKGKVLYVWFDAPIGYISASKEWAKKQGNPDQWKKYWLDPDTKLVNFIGKDNIPFHSVIFPSMIIGQDKPYKLVDELPANEFLQLEGKQFSKSEGWYIDLQAFFEKYDADQIRYMIAAIAPENSDSEFTWKEFQQRCNGDLLGKFGNLINRTLVFSKNNCKGKVPKKHLLNTVDEEFLSNVKKLVDESYHAFSTFKLRKVSQIVMELAHLGNVYFDRKKPWVDAKTKESLPAMETTIACCLDALKHLALIAFPIIPDTSETLWTMLGYKTKIENLSWNTILKDTIPEGQLLPTSKPLFKKIENEQIDAEIKEMKELFKKVQCNKKKPAKKNKEEVTFEEFSKMDLRVGEVVEAKEIKKSKKLLELKINIGFKQCTVVSGISPHYNTTSILGKKVIVLTNLKPCKIMGVESQGMLLAGGSDNKLEIPSFENLPVGSEIT
jgi:methionyl-tRNA synthetase